MSQTFHPLTRSQLTHIAHLQFLASIPLESSTQIPLIPLTPLKRRISIPKQLLKVSLEPRPRLRRRLQRILVSAVRIVPFRRGVAGAVRLAARLDPDDRVDVLVARVGAGPHAEAGVDHVAPVALLDLGGGLHAAAALVDDEVGWEALGFEKRAECVDKADFVEVGVRLGVVRGGAERVSVEVGDYGMLLTDCESNGTVDDLPLVAKPRADLGLPAAVHTSVKILAEGLRMD